MTRTVCNTDDVIDSRDLIARFDELQSEREAIADDLDEMRDEETPDEGAISDKQAELEQWDADNGDELKALKSVCDECEGYGDWRHGETLIRRSYWVDYVQELLQDIGDLPKDLPGYLVIDWEETAGNIEADYMTVDFDGVEYLMRS
jgi:hypothetical protein